MEISWSNGLMSRAVSGGHKTGLLFPVTFTELQCELPKSFHLSVSLLFLSASIVCSESDGKTELDSALTGVINPSIFFI